MNTSRTQRSEKPENIHVVNKIGTTNNWETRKNFALKEVFTSMTDLIYLAKGSQKKSLATLQPQDIIDFVIEDDEREWKQEWLDQLKQMNLFDSPGAGDRQRQVVKKLPYKFFLPFLIRRRYSSPTNDDRRLGD
jgi:hypothetical protein